MYTNDTAPTVKAISGVNWKFEDIGSLVEVEILSVVIGVEVLEVDVILVGDGQFD